VEKLFAVESGFAEKKKAASSLGGGNAPTWREFAGVPAPNPDNPDGLPP